MERNQKALAGALNAAALGMKVIPLSTYTKRKNGEEVWLKMPRIGNWPSLATREAATIQKWASGDFSGTSSKSNKPCEHFGASMDGFFAFDADSQEALEALKKLFVDAGFDGIVPTFSTRTGRGGRHFLYRQPETGEPLGNSQGKIAPKLDTRGGAGGFIVLPGTVNPATGVRYELANDAGIAVLPQAVAEAIRGKVKTAKAIKNAATPERRSGSRPDTPLKIKHAVDFLMGQEGGVEGEGGEADAVYVGRVLGDIGLSEEKAAALAFEIYNLKCSPPWEKEELDAKIHNGYAYRENEIGCDDPDLAIESFGQEETGGLTAEDEARFPVRGSVELRESEPEPRRSLIEGFMAHGKYLTLLYGRGGGGKSLLGWQMLRELMRGKTFLGKTPGSACKDLRPLLLSLEEPKEDVHFRYWKQTGRIDPDGDGADPFWCNLRGINPHFCTAGKNGIEKGDWFDSLVRIIRAGRFNLLLIDSLSRIFPGNENDRAAVTAFGRLMDRLTEATGCHIILLAHTNKAGVFSGSSAWEAICRQMFVVTSENLDGVMVYTLTAEKTNEGPRGEFVRYRFDDWYFVPVGAEEYEKLQLSDGRSKTSSDIKSAEEAVREILDFEGELKYGDLMKKMKEAGHDRGALDFAKESMIASGELIAEERYDSAKRKKYIYLRLAETP